MELNFQKVFFSWTLPIGTTLVTRAVAGEADVPFFYQVELLLLQIYVGMGAKSAKPFAKAKQSAPAIIFIDEIDAVGKARSGKSNDEKRINSK